MTISKDTLADQVYKILKDEILHEVIPSGTKLTLKNLQDKFNLSTTPLREAMSRLSQEGLLIHTTNIGAYVIELSSKDVIELYQLSETLEIAAMVLAYEKAPNELKEVMKQSIEHQRNAIEEENVELFHHYSDDFHDLFFKIADNSRLYEASKRYRNQISILINRYQNNKDALKDVFHEHAAIYDAILCEDLEQAKRLFSMHLCQGKEWILKQL